MVRDMITVFTASYNYSKYLRQSIESVLNQTDRDFEYHLVDYGSTDNTWNIMQEYTKDTRVKAMQIGAQKNKVFAMNHSIRKAKGDAWVWCPADDYFASNLLERKRVYAKRYPKAVLDDDNYVVDGDGKVYGSSRRGEFTDENIKVKIWEKSLIGFTGIYIPMFIFRDIGLYFSEEENYSEDYRWMIEAVERGVKFRHIPEKLHFKRKHKGSCTKKEYVAIIANIEKIHKELKEKYGK